MTTYPGKDIVRGYRRWFGVDKVCALVEMKVCGVDISEEMIAAARREARLFSDDRAKKRALRTSEHTIDQGDQNDQFSFIAGYTSGGAPYGLMWEEYDPFQEDNETRRLACPHERRECTRTSG